MINLVFGCSGSGKTEYLIEKIKTSVMQKKFSYLIVPEQQVFTAEAKLASLPAPTSLYFEVISFSRLCELVFNKYGGRTRISLSGGIRNLIMWQSIREVSPVLADYGSVSDAKLAEKMLQTYDELRANSINSEKLETALQNSDNNDLKNKIGDINLIMSEYTENLQKILGQDAVAEENKLERLCEILSKRNFFDGCNVFIDSFTDFTGIQHKIIAQIMKQADNLWISVSIPERKYHAPHTVSINENLKKLTRSAIESNQSFEDVNLGGNVRTISLQLKLLEKYLWDFSAKIEDMPDIPEEQSHDIEMVSCKNEYEETECAALKILDAFANGMKYSEMAVILRNPEDRAGIIESVFSKYNIPYFISEKTQLTSTPISRFIISSLRCISRNYRQNDVLTLLKSGLCGVDEKDADLFEDYCITWNINGNTFTSPVWSMNPSGFVNDTSDRAKNILTSANLVRRQLIEPLQTLKINFRACNGKAYDMCHALYSYLEECKIPEKLSELAQLELSVGNAKEAGEILRIYDFVLSSLSNICSVLGESKISVDDLIEALQIMLSSTEMASIPHIGEYVIIGSAATLRVEDLKMAVVMELCDGLFPSIPQNSSLICESDRDRLEELGLTFKARNSRLMSDELFYVYRAFVKPSEKLIVTSYSQSISGASRVPSTPWRRLKTIFDIKEEEFDSSAIFSLVNEKDSPSTPPVQNTQTSPAVANDNDMPNTVSDESDENDVWFETVPTEVIQTTFGNSLYLSKSKIQSFVKCPMMFWSQSVLSLRPRRIAEVSTSESGTLIHYALEHVLKEAVNEDGSLPSLDDSEILSVTNKWIDRYVTETECPRTSALMYSFSNLRNMAYLMVQNIFEEFKYSSFKIRAFEKSISDFHTSALKPLAIPLDGIDSHPTVYLGGNVDRIDTYTNEDKTFVRVIDYKTGQVSFKQENVVNGSDLQLPAYLFAVASDENKSMLCPGTTLLPGSATYLSAVESKGNISIVRSGMIYNDDNFIRASNSSSDYSFISTDADKKLNGRSGSLKGCRELLSMEEMEQMRQTLTDTVKNTGEQIYSGVVKRTPSAESCRFCPIRNSCAVACKSNF